MNCTSDGSLDVTHTCAINTCDKPNITDATVSPTSSTVDYLQSYEVICDDNWAVVSGSSVMNCQANETFDQTPSCNGIYCPTLDAGDGTVVCDVSVDPVSCVYSCATNNYYGVSGFLYSNKTVTCNTSTAEWSHSSYGTLPACSELSNPSSYSLTATLGFSGLTACSATDNQFGSAIVTALTDSTDSAYDCLDGSPCSIDSSTASCATSTTGIDLTFTVVQTGGDLSSSDLIDAFATQLAADATAQNLTLSVDDGSKKRATVSLAADGTSATVTSGSCDDGYESYGDSCMICAAGTYELDGTCTDCPVGNYTYSTGMTFCYSCSNSSLSTITTGSDASDDCIVICTVDSVTDGYRSPAAGLSATMSSEVKTYCDSGYTLIDGTDNTTTSCSQSTPTCYEECTLTILDEDATDNNVSMSLYFTETYSYTCETEGESRSVNCSSAGLSLAIECLEITVSSVEVLEDRSVVVTCAISNLSMSDINDYCFGWYSTATLVDPDVVNATDGQSSEITIPADYNTSDISCIVMNNDTTMDSADEILKNYTIPKYNMDISYTNNVVPAGISLEVTCSISNVDTSLTAVWWSIDGTDYTGNGTGVTISTNSSMTESVLTISSLNMTAGSDPVIECKSTVDSENYTSDNVTYLTYYVESVTDNEVLIGEDATVTCVAIYHSATDFEPTIKWMDDSDRQITNDTDNIISSTDDTNGTITSYYTIADIDVDTNVSCVLSNGNVGSDDFDDVSESATLNVFNMASNNDTVLRVGDNVTLYCKVTENTYNITEENIKWSPSNESNYEVEYIYMDSYVKLKLTITAITLDQEGTFDCSARAFDSDPWSTISVEIDVFRIVVVDDWQIPGGDAMPHCHVYNMSSDVENSASVSWTDEDQASVTDDLMTSTSGIDYDMVTFTVPDSATADITYTCTVTVDNADWDSSVGPWEDTVLVDVVTFASENTIKEVGDDGYIYCTLSGYSSSFAANNWEEPDDADMSTVNYTESYAQSTDWNTIKLNVTALTVDVEGQYTCSYTFVRNEDMGMNRTVERIVVVDIAEIELDPSDVYIEVNHYAEFECLARTTEGADDEDLEILPEYTWTVNGVERMGVVSAASDGTSVFTVNATRGLDDADIVCTVFWDQEATDTSVANNITLVAETAKLYSKRVTTKPSSTVHYADGVSLDLTCVYSSYHDSATLNWYQGNVTLSDDADFDMSESTTDKQEKHVLTINSPTSSLFASSISFTCVLEFDSGEGDDWIGYIEIGNEYSVDSLTWSVDQDVTDDNLVSGYGGAFTVSMTGHSDATITYDWYSDSSLLASHYAGEYDSSDTTDTLTISQLMYWERDAVYTARITWETAKQTLESELTYGPLNMTDSCMVDYSDITDSSTTTADESVSYVLDSTVITSTCAKSYLMNAETAYTQTCTVNTTIALPSCEAGCSYDDESNSQTTYTSSDTSALDESGYTTIHTSETLTLSCSTGYTLRASWDMSYTCSSDDITVDGDCVVGCSLTANDYTETTYTSHGKSLLANLDSTTYSCVTDSATSTGATSYTVTCDGTDIDMNQCGAVAMADATVTTRITAFSVVVSDPTYPSSTPSSVTVMLYNSAYVMIESSEVDSSNTVAFANLDASTIYRYAVTFSYTNGFTYTTNHTTVTTEDEMIITEEEEEAMADVEEVSVEVPLASFTYSEYKVLVVYTAEDYIVDLTTTSWYLTYKTIGNRKKRDTGIEIIIYSSIAQLLAAGVDVGAFYAETIPSGNIDSSDSTYTVDYSSYGFDYNADYYVMLALCPNDDTSSPGDCSVGSATVVSKGGDHMFYIAVGLIVFFSVLFIVVACIICGIKTKCRPLKKLFGKNYEPRDTTFQNPAYSGY